MATRRQTLEQQRAASAWKDVNAVQKSQREKYGTLAKKMPAMIQINGLGTSLAFLLAKAGSNQEDGHQLMFNHLSTWVLSRVDTANGYNDLMELVRRADMDIYRRATAEAIEYGIWLKRYVEAKDWGSTQTSIQGVNP